jgi:hypothetical protein
VLGQLTREDEADSGLDLTGRESALLVVADQLARLDGDALERIVDERVHDGHGLGRDARVRVHLLEHLVVGFLLNKPVTEGSGMSGSGSLNGNGI